MMDRISAYRELIRKNIDYENYPPIDNKQEVDELIETDGRCVQYH